MRSRSTQSPAENELASAHAREPQRSARFVSPAELAQELRVLDGCGFLVVPVAVGAAERGRLGEAIDEAIERELSARGAMSPGLAAASSFASYRDATLGDQLFRARRAGAAGIAVVLSPIGSAPGLLATAGGPALSPEDAAALTFFSEAARERSFVLLLDEADRKTPAYVITAPLDAVLLPKAAPTLAPPRPPSSAEWAVGSESEAESGSKSESESASVRPARDGWLPYAVQLTSARGPQSLPALEKLFTESYVPLSSMLAEGLDDPRAREAALQFSASFSKSYTDAFATFAVTGKRPRMVLDAHDVASRIARLHGARAVRLLLVDAMRWDVARDVQRRLAARISGATITDEVLLWSALPTTTLRQLETIARGMEALRAPAPLETDAEPPRGRNAEYVRRMRIGPREVHKLDLFEARLQGARSDVLRDLPAIAETAAEVLARHVESLAPRTLLFVFGDHGFTVDRRGNVSQGGASPEEVLVGGFALLVGEVH